MQVNSQQKWVGDFPTTSTVLVKAIQRDLAYFKGKNVNKIHININCDIIYIIVSTNVPV